MKLKLEELVPNGKVWITSDTHYAHKSLCRGITAWKDREGYEDKMTRDFPDLDPFNQAIVDGINSKVGPDDLLLHLGDWAFGGHEGNVFLNVMNFRNRLTCRNLIFLTGNHDQWMEDGDQLEEFSDSFDLCIIDNYLECTLGKKHLVLFHFPIESWNKGHKDGERGSYHLHGHVHTDGDDRFSTGRKMDVGVDGSPDFAPYLLTDVIEILKDKPRTLHHEN